MTTPIKLPRRANGIRRLAADMAHRKLTELTARQAISDRIGYGIAALLGATAFHFGGSYAVEALTALYGLSAARAYWRYRKVAGR